MDLEDVIGTIIAVIMVVFIICTLGVLISDMVMDSNSNVLCKANGHDYGTSLFWKKETVCTDVVQEEKLELICIPSPCR